MISNIQIMQDRNRRTTNEIPYELHQQGTRDKVGGSIRVEEMFFPQFAQAAGEAKGSESLLSS